MDEAKLKEALETVFAADSALYQNRGFQRRIGYGTRPALVNIDLANAWTRPGNPFTCEHIDDQIIPGVQRLLAACREHGHPVVHVTPCYQVPDRDNPTTDMGLWHSKIPIEVVDQNNAELWAIDSRIEPTAETETTWVRPRDLRPQMFARKFSSWGRIRCSTRTG